MLAAGRANKQISHQLKITVETVKAHLKSLYGKLGVENRTGAAIAAVRHGLVHLQGFVPSVPREAVGAESCSFDALAAQR